MYKKSIAIFVGILAMVGAVFAQSSYFTGDGRKDLSIEVDQPKLSGNLTDEASWIPDFVVNMLCDDIAKYSAITVVDTNNLDRVIAAQKRGESEIYNQEDAVELGNLTIAKNLLIVNITAKSTSYAVSLKVNNKESNTSLAAFNEPNCSVSDLENGIVLKKAVADLLGQLGVKLTDEGKKSLTDVATQTSTIEAQKNIAKGTAAMQSGSSIEALSYFVKAKNSDNNLKRASVAMSKAGTVVATTDFASNVRNVIKMRKDFIALVDDTTKYLSENFPYSVVYSKELEMGNINYSNETFEMKFKFTALTNFEARELVQNIYEAYLTMPDHENWGITGKLDNMIPAGTLKVAFEAKDGNGKVIGTKNYDVRIYGYSVTRYPYGKDESARVTQGLFNISQNEDTSVVTYTVASVKYDNESISVTCAAFSDYVENVIIPSVEMTEIFPDIHVVTASRGLDVDTYNNVLRNFGYDLTMQKLADKVATGNFVDASNIVYRYAEKDFFDSFCGRYKDVKKSNKAIGRNVMSTVGQVVITNNDKSFPRNKDEFIKVAVTAIRMKFVQIPGETECFYLKNDKETTVLMEKVFEKKVSTYGFEYWKTESFGHINANSATCFSSLGRDAQNNEFDKFMQQVFGSLYPTITAFPQKNHYRVTYDGGSFESCRNILGMESFVNYYKSNPVSDRSVGGPILNVAVKTVDISRIEVLKAGRHVYTNKKDSYYEVTEDFYNKVIELAAKYGIKCTLPEYDTLPRKDWTVEFINVINKLTQNPDNLFGAKFIAVKDGDLKKLAKDPNGKKIADDMSANPNKLYVNFYGK